MPENVPTLRWWRFRWTIRRMMVTVALAAIILYFAIPVAKGLIWLASNRGSTGMFWASIWPRPPVVELPQADLASPTYQVGQPFRMEVAWQAKPTDWIPAGLAYRTELRVKIIDPTTSTIVEETQKQVRWLTTGYPLPHDGWSIEMFSFTPRKPGKLAVQYELWVSDLFGRSSQDASSTFFFTAQ